MHPHLCHRGRTSAYTTITGVFYASDTSAHSAISIMPQLSVCSVRRGHAGLRDTEGCCYAVETGAGSGRVTRRGGKRRRSRSSCMPQPIVSSTSAPRSPPRPLTCGPAGASYTTSPKPTWPTIRGPRFPWGSSVVHLHPRHVSPHGPRHALPVLTADRRPPADAAIQIVAPFPGVMGGVCLGRRGPGEIEEKYR